MSRVPFDAFRRLAAVVALGAIVTGCATPDPAGVRVSAVEADIVFGIADPEKATVPPQTVGVDEGGFALGEPLPVPFSNRIPSRFRDVAFEVDPKESAAAACPTAPIGSAPSAPAPTNAKAPPAEGLYRYKISGKQKTTVNGGSFETPLTGFQPRVLRDLDKVSDTRWTFDVVQPNGDGGIRVTKWSINTAATARRVNPPYVGENPVRVAEPDSGVSILSVKYFDANGNQIGEYTPSSAVLHMPMPIIDGESFNSAGVDPRTGQTMRVAGEVKTRKAVDACGTMVDGWLVTLEITDARGSDSGNRVEELVISTDQGGLILSQHIVEQTVSGVATRDTDVTYTIGQTAPTPVKES